MPLNTTTGAFTFTSPTQATGAVPGGVIQSAAWNQIDTDIQNAVGQVYQQMLSNNSITNNLAWGNGGFEVWQRAAGGLNATININSTLTTGTYGPDRWYLSTPVSCTCSVTAVAGIDTPNNSVLACQITRNTGTTGGPTVFGYPLDAEQAQQLRGQKVGVSFWAKTGAGWSPTSGTLTISVITGTGAPVKQVGGTYAGSSTIWQATVNIAANTAATLYSLSNLTVGTNIAGGATVGQAEVQFSWTSTGAGGATDSITFDNVQFETFDSLAAPYNNAAYVIASYDHVPLQLMLLDCKQHYQKTFPYAVAPAQSVAGGAGSFVQVGPVASVRIGAMYLFNPGMRATPTVTTFAPSAASSNWLDFTATTTIAATVTVSSSAGVLIYSAASVAVAGDIIGIHLQADAGI